MGWHAHPLGYQGVNLRFTIETQRATIHAAMARQRINGLILAHCTHQTHN
jgi:hypothetical protein